MIFCLCQKKETPGEGAMVSRAREHWCPEGVDCAKYMVEIVQKEILGYSRSDESKIETHNLNANYVSFCII